MGLKAVPGIVQRKLSMDLDIPWDCGKEEKAADLAINVVVL